MKSKLRKLLLIGLMVASLGATALPPKLAYAEDDVCGNNDIAEEVRKAAGCKEFSTADKLPSTVLTILNSIIAVSGVIAVIFVIIGGVSYMTSAGDPGKAKKAKDTILYALIGMVICVLAFAIVNFVILKIIK